MRSIENDGGTGPDFEDPRGPDGARAVPTRSGAAHEPTAARGRSGDRADPRAEGAAELAAERAYLQRGRRALHGMRDEARNTRMAEGDPVGDKATNEFLRQARKRRIASLADGGDTPLFFARLDYAAHGPDAGDAPGAGGVARSGAGAGNDDGAGNDGGSGGHGRPGGAGGGNAAVAGRRFYLGRRYVRESAGDDPLVVDWRADVARPFYRAHRGDPMGVRTRRRFGYDAGILTAYEDEPVMTTDPPAPSGGTSPSVAMADPAGTPGPPTTAQAVPAQGVVRAGSLVEREIERPRSGPMRDIVATIAPEQDEIVRADLSVSLCVQGAPGTGKTAVGLHRAAYLLFAHRERLARAGVLVVGPNQAFLRYIAAVLPALGENAVRHVTVDELVGTVGTDGTDSAVGGEAGRGEPVASAVLKGDARLAAVLRAAAHGGLRPPDGQVSVTTRVGRWTVGEQDFADLFTAAAAALRAGTVRYVPARERLAGQLANAVRRRAELGGHFFTDGALRTLARSRPIRDAVDAVWPALDAPGLVHRLLTDPDLLARAGQGILHPDEQALLLATAPPGPARRPRWSRAEAFLVDEARDLLEGTEGVGHLIVDEAQDLSAMQCRALARRCLDGSLTVLGDLAQGTTPWAATSWPAQLGHLGRRDAHLEVLTRGYRVPAEILAFANRLLARIAPDLPPAVSVRTAPGALAVLATADVPGTVAEAARVALTREGSLAVIAADGDVAGLLPALRAAGLPVATLGDDEGVPASTRASLVPASLAKGLEFDHVIAVEPASIVAAETEPLLGERRLYVALTRAVSALTVVHADALPEALRDPVPAG
ncbi:putative ATP-dependent DNA helicase [Frankia sp. AiPs1]|uniref:HelD family protein n=1 Tax=Frankia sp. AiPa1 TaxID=573492 RepID=UPI00202B35BE|nr:AAA family ATPase [Frankia sp. AiPa1]MCL9762057.1 AAA family ATPase [Frankia sp. AiPa1]